MIKNQIKVSLMSVPENVPLARVIVAAFAAQLDFTLEEIEDIKVAASEAVSNCLIHGYENSPYGSVDVSCSIIDDRLEIVIEDHGKGIEDIKKAMEPAFSTDPERMGLGFTFMQSFMDALEVSSTVNEGTRVVMLKSPQEAAVVASEEN